MYFWGLLSKEIHKSFRGLLLSEMVALRDLSLYRNQLLLQLVPPTLQQVANFRVKVSPLRRNLLSIQISWHDSRSELEENEAPPCTQLLSGHALSSNNAKRIDFGVISMIFEVFDGYPR